MNFRKNKNQKTNFFVFQRILFWNKNVWAVKTTYSERLTRYTEITDSNFLGIALGIFANNVNNDLFHFGW